MGSKSEREVIMGEALPDFAKAPSSYGKHTLADFVVEEVNKEMTRKLKLPPKTAEEHYWEIHEEIKNLHKAKGADYGTVQDPFDNLRAASDFGMPCWVGVALRMRDKMSRIQTFVKKGELVNESIEDSFLDMANYAMLGLALYREEQEKKNERINKVSAT